MDEVITGVLWFVLRSIVFVAFEILVLEVFYYIGAAPVWVVTFGKCPGGDPSGLPMHSRLCYAVLGILLTIGLAALYYSLDPCCGG